MHGFGTAEVARLLGMTPRQVRRLARAGFLRPARGPRQAYRFSFQDVVLLRAAKALAAAAVPAKRIHRALRTLVRQLPHDRPLSELRITAEGDHIVVRDGRATWVPESAQLTLDFLVADLATDVASLTHQHARRRGRDEPEDAEGWFALAVELETVAPAESEECYRRALQLNPDLPEALINLGRLLQAQSRLHEAEDFYRRARTVQPDLAVAAFNLGTALDEQGRTQEAIDAYLAAVDVDPGFADAHYNLSGLYEQAGNAVAAFRHLRQYRELTGRRTR
ncbi:MAG: tetratricopeptide repeat protein [Gemmatimonadota bacterium]|nr:tetratricopeptide repeat protein [Gemmatimonadota bacterium]MDH5198521.1 tetratricopeptide repeat protein [Gemmatimonadota bacterium]